MAAIYDSVGKSYDTTRRADPKILAGVIEHLGLGATGRVLDVGCGSGNYTIALRNHGYDIQGVDISGEMLRKARTKAPQLPWHLADARRLPFGNAEFDGVVSVLATHHMRELDAVLLEVFRVLKPGGKLVLFTSTPTQIRAFWLNHYLPTVVPITAEAMLEFDSLKAKLAVTGFSQVGAAPFVVDNSLQDFFLHCGKYRPELYLDPTVRAGISTFALCHDAQALDQGLKLLAEDIRTGKVQEIIKQHENALGDFMYVWAQRPV